MTDATRTYEIPDSMQHKVISLADAPEIPGRRTFLQYFDVGIADASNGLISTQVTKVRAGMTNPTGWHYHDCVFQWLFITKGWLELQFENGESKRIEQGSVCFIPGATATTKPEPQTIWSLSRSSCLPSRELSLSNHRWPETTPRQGRPHGTALHRVRLGTHHRRLAWHRCGHRTGVRGRRGGPDTSGRSRQGFTRTTEGQYRRRCDLSCPGPVLPVGSGRIVRDTRRDRHLDQQRRRDTAGSLDEADLAAWQRAWDLKVWGYLELSQLALKAMRSRRSGVIVNVVGLSGERPDAGYLAGSMANSALMTFTRAVGAYSLDDGLRVVAVNPGPVQTQRLLDALHVRARTELGASDRWSEFVEHYPAQRMATAEEVADTIAFLASRRSSYTSGTVVTLDGGMAWRGRAL